jgi:Ca2+:H+ antiporter
VNRLQAASIEVGSALAAWSAFGRGAGLDRLPVALVLGLEARHCDLVLTFVVSAITLGTGRTYMMQGAVHLVLFAAFLFLAFVP